MYGRVWWFRASVVAAALLVASGCAGTDFVKPIADFNQATMEAQKNLKEQQTKLDAAILEYSLGVATKPAPPTIFVENGGCVPSAQSCRLFITETDPETKEQFDWPFTQSAINHGVLDLMDGIAVYTANLKAVAEADTASKVEQSTKATMASVVSIAGTIDALGERPANSPDSLQAEVSKFSGPVVELINFASRRYIEHVKIGGLRSAVNMMQVVFPDIATEFEELAFYADLVRLGILDKKFSSAWENYMNNPTNTANITAIRAVAEEYNGGLLQAKPKLFQNLAGAHETLADALNRHNLSFEDLWPYLQAVFAETAKLAQIIEQLQQASEKKG